MMRASVLTTIALIGSVVLGEPLVAQTMEYARGDRVRVALGSSQDDGEGIVIARAGDRVEFSRSGVVVNGIAVTDLLRRFFAILAPELVVLEVPEGKYLLAVESTSSSQRANSFQQRLEWGLFSAEEIRAPIARRL